MKKRYNNHYSPGRSRTKKLLTIFSIALVVLLVVMALNTRNKPKDNTKTGRTTQVSKNQAGDKSKNLVDRNPLKNRTFYIDTSRSINQLVAQYNQANNATNAQLAQRIASQPGTTWLIGPSAQDSQANNDIEKVRRTSSEAAKQGKVVVYQLYAIPQRDACAEYSKGGHTSNASYLDWLERIIGSLEADAVFSVEADAVAQTIQSNCLSPRQIADRYELLSATLSRLKDAPKVLATYLDAGHSEWFADPSVMIEPLRKAGIAYADGVAVNVSNFVATPEITKWSQKLVTALGGNKGVIIDTSRNGKGVAPAGVIGDARWCNPSGRGIGPNPTTNVDDAHIDAYFWGKIIGESDGSCRGYPAAGVFVPEIALELARNSSTN